MGDWYTSRRRTLERKAATFGGWWDAAERLLRGIEAGLWRMRHLEVIECFGDSHAGVFRVLNQHPACRRVRFRAIPVNGATVFGLANPNSKTNALNIFHRWLKRVDHSRPVVFLLGEVDMGFLVWWRAQQSGEAPESIMMEAIGRYQRFLAEVREAHPRLIVVSAPLPTIRDGQDYGEIANLRREIRASQVERTALTIRFNAAIASWCNAEGICHLSLDRCALDPNTSLVRPELLNANPRDHHYDSAAFSALLVRVLKDHKILIS